MDDVKAFGKRLREVRIWRDLTLREAADLAGLSFSFWGQVERGDKTVTTFKTLEAMAAAMRVHPSELTGQPWTRHDGASTEAHAGLIGIATALERYELGVDPQLPVRAWPQIQADVDRLVWLSLHVVDYAVQSELAPVLIGELYGAYVRLPQRRREVLLGLIDAHRVAIMTAKVLGGHGLPGQAARAVPQCAEALDDVVWLGCATYVRGYATGELDDTSATHLDEAAALAARMNTPVGTWANLFFGPTSASGAPTSLLSAASTARPWRPPRRCTRSYCPCAARLSSGLRSVVRSALGRTPATRACTCCCTPRNWPPN